jgi:hypothetical protein
MTDQPADWRHRIDVARAAWTLGASVCAPRPTRPVPLPRMMLRPRTAR